MKIKLYGPHPRRSLECASLLAPCLLTRPVSKRNLKAELSVGVIACCYGAMCEEPRASVDRIKARLSDAAGDTVVVAETGSKLPVWSDSTSCARTPLMV